MPERAKHLRVVLLEMERLYNHVDDVGMIARVMADAGGRLSRVKVIDPSCLNWRPLS